MKWELRINQGWHTNLRFRFNKIAEAENFLEAFVENKIPDEDDDDREWKYTIIPVFKETAENKPEEE